MRATGIAYVYKLGDTGIYKVGKTTDLEKRQGTYETISTEPLDLYAQIETINQSEVEKFMKERLQSRRWLGGRGRELYEVDRAELDEVIDAARRFSLETLPKLIEAERLTKQESDGRVLTPGDVEKELHRELLRLRQVELMAQQEQRRIAAELKLLMQTASRIDGIVKWKNKTTTTLDTARLKRERRDIHDAFYTKFTITRPFEVRW
jgi:Meiotically up-regulated gene 113